MKEVIISVLTNGKDSKRLNEFIKICFGIALACFHFSKYRDFILNKTGLAKDDIAYDSIADLFKDTDGKYLYIEHHFHDEEKCINDLNEEELYSKLEALVVSRTNQHITEIRKDFGEIYFSVKKAIKLHINRHKNKFKLAIYRGEVFIYTCKKSELDFKKNCISDEFIIDYLNSIKHGKRSVPALINFIFECINKNKDYCGAVNDLVLYKATTEFFKTRMQDFINDLENVPYNISREGI